MSNRPPAPQGHQPARPYAPPRPVQPPGQAHGQPPGQPYGPPPGQPYGPPPLKAPLPPGMEQHRGITVMVLGAMGIITCLPFFSVVAWVMGSADLKKMARGQMDPEGFFLTRIGRICGIIGTILGVLWVGFFVTMFLLPFVMMFVQASRATG